MARYDVFKLSEAVLSGQVARVQRMLDGLQAEGEAAVLAAFPILHLVEVGLGRVLVEEEVDNANYFYNFGNSS